MIKEFFKNDVGKYDPAAEKLGIKSVIWGLSGFAVWCVFLPTILTCLEAWDFSFQIDKIVWHENDYYKNLRIPYFACLFLANISVLCTSGLSAYRINGKLDRLSSKKLFRALTLIFYPLGTGLYIAAIVIY